MTLNADLNAESKNSTRTVSIVVIAYNEQSRILDCLNSIQTQTFSDIEVIVVDDGSLDKTPELLLQYSLSEPRLRVIAFESNKGRGAARLAGLQAASSPLIAFVDADIVLSPSWLQSLVDALPGHSAVSGIAVPDGDCAVLWRIFRPTARINPGSEQITGNNVLFLGDVIREIGFDAHSRLGEDFRLASRLRALGHSLATIPSVTVQHREAKTYAKAILWLYESGVDASSLLLEFRRIRLPDITWATWFTLHLLLLPVALLLSVYPLLVLLTSTILTVLPALGHAFARFQPFPHPLRFLAASLANIPLMTAYLIGRTVGTLRLLFSR
jgi:glycosyltransferase involved in cell wall biosynthesis